MDQIVTATFDHGVLKPDTPLDLPANARVRLTIERLQPEAGEPLDALDALDQLCDEYPIDSEGNILTRDQLHERR